MNLLTVRVFYWKQGGDMVYTYAEPTQMNDYDPAECEALGGTPGVSSPDYTTNYYCTQGESLIEQYMDQE